MKVKRKMTKRQWNSALAGVLSFFLVLLAIVVGMNVKNTMDLRGILEDSVKSQLVAASIAAREIIDAEAFVSYDSDAVKSDPEYVDTLLKLRHLCNSIGAEYIYALKEHKGEYVFVFDTDEENEDIFIPYELSPVHIEAFAGVNAADTMNVEDEYGSFNTGAVPIIKDGQVVGIIATDIEDSYLGLSYQKAMLNAIVLIGILVLTMTGTFVVIVWLLKKIKKMQDHLQKMAHYDNVTGLPNRQYLLDLLDKSTAGKNKQPFALFFVDLDNFKQVNDNAGHDAGDELLRQIGLYLENALENSTAFRPTAGILNIAARIGGDEFIQLIRGVDSEESAAKVAEKLLAGFRNQHTERYIDKFNVGLSIGIALYPFHTNNYHVLIKYADTAMYHAKKSGKNQYRFYVDEMSGTER